MELTRPMELTRSTECVEYIQITEENSFLLNAFIFSLSENPSKHFRYYDTRSYDEYKKHVYTVILINNMLPVAYGHIELEDKYWIALCVLEKHRSKGYGKRLISHLINIAKSKRIPRLSLSVDKDNAIAISLYRSHNFVLLYEYDKYYLMMLNLLPSAEMVTLPVSYGDAFDKLAILEIKMTKVNEVKRVDVKKEYDAVLSSISYLFDETVRFYYKHLVDCSIIIWDKQVTFRSATSNRTELCEEIIFENDRRGKLKNKVNKILSSYLVEQKDGYVLKKAFVSISNTIISTKLDIHLIIIGMVRYLATVYDEVLVYTKKTDQFALIYLDDDTIKCTTNNECQEGYTPFVIQTDQELPTLYYSQVGLREEYFFSYFYIPSTEKSKELYSKVKGREYIIVHSNERKIFDIQDIMRHSGREEVPIIDISMPHEEFEDFFITRNIIDYKDLLINASALYLSDSSLFSLALNLELKSDHCYYVPDQVRDYSPVYDHLPANLNRKRFISINLKHE